MAENNEIFRPAELELIDGGSRGKVPTVFHFNQKQVTIGRGPTNVYIWRWENVSRRHVAFEYQDSTWLIKDMSANGIKLNDDALPKDTFVPLKNDDLVKFKVGYVLTYRFKCYGNSDDSDDEDRTLYETVLSTLSGQDIICPLTQTEYLKKKSEGGVRQPLTPVKSGGGSKLFSLICGIITSKNLWGNVEGPQLEPEGAQGASKNSVKRQDGQTIQTEYKHDAYENIECMQYLLRIKEQCKQIRKLESEIRMSKDTHRLEVNKLEEERQKILEKQAMFRTRAIQKVLKCFDDEFKCAICTKVIIHRAEIIGCGHTFCQECLIMRHECPKCNHPIAGAINSYALRSYAENAYMPLISDVGRH